MTAHSCRAPARNGHHRPRASLAEQVRQDRLRFFDVPVRVKDHLPVPPHSLRPLLVVLALAVISEYLRLRQEGDFIVPVSGREM